MALARWQAYCYPSTALLLSGVVAASVGPLYGGTLSCRPMDLQACRLSNAAPGSSAGGECPAYFTLHCS